MGMIIEIDRREGHVLALGHSVPLELGGEPELKRRCYEGLSKLNSPPNEVVFVRRWELEQEPEEATEVAGPGSAVMSTVMLPVAPVVPSQPTASQPSTVPATPAAIKAPPRSHKRKT